MSRTKRQVREVLDRLPEDCAIEDVQYHLYVVDKIRRRQEAVERGEQLVPQSEAELRLASYRRIPSMPCTSRSPPFTRWTH